MDMLTSNPLRLAPPSLDKAAVHITALAVLVPATQTTTLTHPSIINLIRRSTCNNLSMLLTYIILVTCPYIRHSRHLRVLNLFRHSNLKSTRRRRITYHFLHPAYFSPSEAALRTTTTTLVTADVETAPLDFIPSHGELPRDELQSDAAPASPHEAFVDVSTNFQPSSRPQTPVSSRSSAGSVAASVSSMTNSKQLFGGWAIWSRRPHDPSRAPGIIISPYACPPPDVVEKSLQLPTPPSTPRLRPVPIVLAGPSVPEHDHAHVDVSQPGDEVLPKIVADELSPPPDQLSSSATETETTPGCSTAPDTPIPGSPLSTNTSISITGTALSHGKAGSQPSKSPKAKIIAADGLITTPSSELQSFDASAALVATPQPEASSSTPSEPVPPVMPAPAPAPAAPKKSWADMLRNPGVAAAGKGPNALPTSSVVGFSIPASASPDSQAHVTPRRPELVNLLSGTPPAQTGAPRIRPRGLINTGNMCFANAVLQLLVYCPPFWRLFNELGKYLPGEQKDAVKSQTPFVDATVTFLTEFRPEERSQSANGFFNGNARVNGNGKGKEVELHEEEEDRMDSFIPSYIYEAMKETKRFENMRGGHQEDAEEFLGFYLDTLEEELLSLLSRLNPSKAAPALAPANTKAVEEREEELPKEDGWLEVGKRNKLVVTRTVKSAESPVTRIFGGKFRSTLRVPHQRDSVMVEDWRALQLDIQPDTVRTIKDALSHISHPQSVQVTSPTKPGIVIEASQQILIESLPPILVLHLKRFLYDTTTKGVVKIGKMVEFSPELEIPNDIMAPGRRSAHAMRYQLYGVLYHHGMSASGGHYTLDVLHPNRDLSTKPREAWVRIDDELVSDVRPADVFDGLDRDDRCAYLLFYRRVGAGARS
ncbi:hypothetical protein EWM64_g2336 [Hericium alpestre]|uniref:Ubiquitin carboxyl-terminal hydrolase n=1 Tax=Hericium alpestre TaxID=135208 RepID=A0A4Z0A610_9AGAM|nr:hypothetical protein EWM64_g2336 [Hericium alpestre]